MGIEATKRTIHRTMLGLEMYPKFSIETEEDFADKWLPTLDTKLRVTYNNIILYKFYEKPTNPKTIYNKKTAMAKDIKIRSLTNEVIRGMVSSSEDVTVEERCNILYEMWIWPQQDQEDQTEWDQGT